MSCEAIHCADTATVRFAIYPDGFDGPRIVAWISEQALRDLFGAGASSDSLVTACRLHFTWIERKALERYQARPGRAMRLVTADFLDLPVLPLAA